MLNKWNFSVSKVLMSSMAALLVASSACAIPADPCNPPKPVCCEKPAPGPYAFAYEKDMGLSCPSDFFFSAEFLAMQPKLEGLEYGVQNSSNGAGTVAEFPLSDGDILGFSHRDHNWDWNYGFRAGLGFTINHDAWNVDLGWTYLRLKDDTSDSIRGTGAIVPLWLPPATDINQGASASERWSGDLNAFDMKLGKAFHVSRYLVVDPFMGIRAAWIDQKILARHFGLYTFPGGATQDPEMDAENDFWGVGTRAGLDTEWILNGGWKLIGNVAASILYGKFDVKQQLNLVGSQIEMHHEFYTHVPVFDMAMGIAWGYPFAEDRYHVDLALTYEFHEWFNQNRMRRFMDSSGAIAANTEVSNGNLSYSGFAFKVQFDF